jgi:NADPH-dependent 2,4-dienoyl-CoA reductase/sulfur reductase-like enzyme/peroxiredoxin family protein/rhodanese-related sulfurtransferase/TusA-related sulfurtransferase
MPKTLIVGGVAGGATTAARLRRNDEQAEIIVFERGEHISYANCGLPYYIGGTIAERDRLFVQTPAKFYDTLNVEVRNWSEVQKIDREKKTVLVKNLQTGESYSESYDKLVLSPGAEPVRPPIKGIENQRIFTVRNVKDTDQLKSFLDENPVKKAVVVGAGFIGLEMAENLHERGIFVTIVEMAAQVMTMLDYEMAAEVHQHLKTKGVEFYLGDGVQSFQGDKDGIALKLSSGRTLEADLVILSIGVRPETTLAQDAGLETGKTRGIKVNEYLQTNDPDIYALGDAIEFPSPITGQPTITYLAGPANKQGRIVADNIVRGNQHRYHGSIGTAVAKVFDITVASTGVSEKTLKKEHIDYRTCITHSSSHAGYYPGASAMTLKLLFSPEDGKVLGAQIVGFDGVDKRIDLIATVLRRGGNITDLTEIEHAYAPPYSSAKDPVNIIGFVAENILLGRSEHIRWDELRALPDQERFLIDVRTTEEFSLGAIEGAVNIPQQEIRSKLQDIPKNKTVVVYCGVGLRAYLAERILRQNGFEKVFNLSGGMKTYEHAIQKQSNEDLFAADFIGNDDQIYQADQRDAGPARPVQTSVKGKMVFHTVDACGLQCPGPILKLKKSMEDVPQGEAIEIVASDPGFRADVKSWCDMTGNTLEALQQEKDQISAVIRKGTKKAVSTTAQSTSKDTSLVVFSDDFDRALAALVIANGAASAGKETTLFFTFWGLNIIKKHKAPKVKKGLIEKMFGWMLPKSSKKLTLSKLNMGGMGTAMMRGRMKDLGINSLEELIASAQQNGVKFVACNMSMDVMGVAMEELIDGVEMGGVASFLGAADSSAATLFI